jgi:hypothetical protein
MTRTKHKSLDSNVVTALAEALSIKPSDTTFIISFDFDVRKFAEQGDLIKRYMESEYGLSSCGSGTNFMMREIEFGRPEGLSIGGLREALVRLTGDTSINVHY